MNTLELDSIENGSCLETRREFIKGGLAAMLMANLVGMPTLARATAFTADEHLQGLRFVYDKRFPDALEIARATRLPTAQLMPINGDVTALWAEILQPNWAKNTQVITGVTTPSALFCLEQLAATYRMRVALRVDVVGDVQRGGLRGADVAALLERGHDAASANMPRSRQLHGASNSLVAWIIAPTDAAAGRVV
jgi:hypothetical protein